MTVQFASKTTRQQIHQAFAPLIRQLVNNAWEQPVVTEPEAQVTIAGLIAKEQQYARI